MYIIIICNCGEIIFSQSIFNVLQSTRDLPRYYYFYIIIILFYLFQIRGYMGDYTHYSTKTSNNILYNRNMNNNILYIGITRRIIRALVI